MPNPNPIKFLSGPETANLTEAQLPSSINLRSQGDLFFRDINKAATESVSTTVTASRSGGGAVPLSNATLLAALTTSLEEYNNGGVRNEIDWNFSLPQDAVSFLAAGETLTLTYDISVTDSSGATATQAVTVTVLGVAQPVVITSGTESSQCPSARRPGAAVRRFRRRRSPTSPMRWPQRSTIRRAPARAA
jgi:VCBS repeat-containing protein